VDQKNAWGVWGGGGTLGGGGCPGGMQLADCTTCALTGSYICCAVSCFAGLKINAKLGGVNVRLAGNPDQVQ
jgi:hypothetical protein